MQSACCNCDGSVAQSDRYGKSAFRSAETNDCRILVEHSPSRRSRPMLDGAFATESEVEDFLVLTGTLRGRRPLASIRENDNG